MPPKKQRKTVDEVLKIDDFLPKSHGSRILTCGQGDMGQLGMFLVIRIRNIYNKYRKNLYLGHGEDRLSSTKPRKMEALPAGSKHITQVQAGGVHTLVLDDRGFVSLFTFASYYFSVTEVVHICPAVP